MRKPSRTFIYHGTAKGLNGHTVSDYTGTKWKNDPIVTGKIKLVPDSIYRMNGHSVSLTNSMT